MIHQYHHTEPNVVAHNSILSDYALTLGYPLAPGRLRQENGEFKASLGDRVKTCHRTKQQQ